MFDDRAGLVIEGNIKSTLLPQKFNLFHGTGGPDDFAASQLRQLPSDVANGTSGTGDINDIASLDLHQIQTSPCGHARHAERAKINRQRLNVGANRMQFFRRSDKIFPPTEVGSDGIARLEFTRPRLDDLADGPTAKRFAQLERRNIRFPLVHAPAHIRVHRHEKIVNQHLPVLQRLQFDLRRCKVDCGWNPVGAGSQPDFMADNF